MLHHWIMKVINYLAFYCIWFIAIWAASLNHSWIAILAASIYLSIHLATVSESPLRESICIGGITIVGLISDYLLSTLGYVSYIHTFLPGISLWSIALWSSFGSTYWHAFYWLENRPIIAIGFGAIGGPVCYQALAYAGMITLGGVHTLLWIGGIWAILLPLSFMISQALRPNTREVV